MTKVATSHEMQLNRLRDAFENRRCVSAWLGYADVLFLGFGNAVLPQAAPGDRHARPPYELETNYAAWRVDGEISGAWTDQESNRPELTAAAESLVGEAVLAWEKLDTTLRVVFTGAKVLTIEAWPLSDGVSEAWSLSAPDGKILAVCNDGRFVVVDAEMPIADWFK